MATLYIFRPYLTDNASGVWPVTYLNDTKVADVKVNSYTYIYVKPGTYRIRTERSEFISGLGNTPGEFSVRGTGQHFLAFISSGRSSFAMVGTVPMTISGPTDHYWALLTERDAMLHLGGLRYMAPAVQTLPQ